MAIQVFEPVRGGQSDLSVDFGNVVFAILPAGITLFILLFMASTKRPWQRTSANSSTAATAVGQKSVLLFIFLLHATSLGLYCHLNADSELLSPSSLAAYTLRLLAALFISVAAILFHTKFRTVTDLYLLITCLADGFRVRTLWTIVSQFGDSTGTALFSLQTAIMVAAAGSVIYAELAACKKLEHSRKIAGPAHVSEETSGILSMLFFGWLWPLLAYGNKNNIVVADVESTTIRSAAIYNLPGDWKTNAEDKKFFSELGLQFLFGVCLQVLYAGAVLAQPFIVQGIVSYLQSEKSNASASWLIVAMVFDQLAVTLLAAHGNLAFGQMSMRMRSFLIHKVSLRSFGSKPPVGGWNSAEGKILVHVTQDAAAVSGAIGMMGMIIPNIFVVSIGSYMLFKLINLAFLGPLFASVACTLVPMLMAGPVSRSERSLLEATERRIATVKHLISEIRNMRFSNMHHIMKIQAMNERKQEIGAATAFRRILTVVIVAAVFLSSLATLTAFGGYSLLPQRNLDYSVLFTSLSTMQIMLTPLLSIIQMLPALIGSWVSWKRVFTYLEASEESLQGPPLNIEKSVSTDRAHSAVQMDSLPPRPGNSSLKIEALTSGWNSNSSFIEHANLDLAASRLAIVAGTAGSGKSSLLRAVLGETQVSAGSIQIGAKRISFCNQELWFIPEASIKENILFGKSFDEVLYSRVVACCCLNRDFGALDDGDDTSLSMIGSPLSGGQRRRVALARTLYDSGDLFLLDDIFNGLDPRTRNEVATNLFGTRGFLPERSAAAILCLTETPIVMSTFDSTEFYVLESGHLNEVEKSAHKYQAAEDGSEGDDIAEGSSAGASDPTPESPPTSEGSPPPDTTTVTAEGADSIVTTSKKSLEAHRIYFRSFGSPVTIALILGFLLAGVAIDRTSSFWLSHWASQFTKLGIDVNNGYYVGIYAAFSVSGVLVTFVYIWIFFMKAIPDSSINLHKDMMSTLMKTPASSIELHKSETVNRFTNDIEAVDLHLPQALENMISSTASAIGSIVVIGIGSPFTLISLPILLPLIFFLQKFYLSTSFQLRSLQIAAQAPMLEMISATVKGRTTIIAFGQEEHVARMISSRIQRGLKIGYLFRAIQTWVTLMLNLLNGCVAIALAALLVGLGGSKSVTWGGLALVNVIRLGQDAMLLLQWWTDFESSMASMDRIYDYLRGTPQESAGMLEADLDTSWPAHGLMQVDTLSFAYRSRIIVKDLTLNIPPGTKLAILGRTGSGKTSLLQSFFSLIQRVDGAVEIDGINLASLDADAIRSRFVGHPQSFIANPSATVRQNLDPLKTVSDARIEEVLVNITASHVTADIMSRLDSPWNECNFSDGWQRIIAIARTLIRTSSVYIMDEPTSGMDDDSHSQALAAIFNTLHDKTVLCTTHTLVGIEKFDKIIVLDGGRLVEQGSPAKLLATPNSIFNQLIGRDASNPMNTWLALWRNPLDKSPSQPYSSAVVPGQTRQSAAAFPTVQDSSSSSFNASPKKSTIVHLAAMPREANEQDPLLADDDGWPPGDEATVLLDEEAEAASASPFTQKITALNIAVYICYIISAEIGQTLSAKALHQVVEENLCREMYGRTDAKFCGAADDVQSEHAVVMGWYSTAQLVPGLICAIPYALLADRYGQKPFFVLNEFGMALAATFARIICFWPSIFPVHLIWIAPLLYFIGGGIGVSTALLFANLTGLTTDTARASMISILITLSYGPRLIATVIASRLLALHGPWPLLWTSLLFSFIAVGFTCFFVEPESSKKSATSGSDDNVCISDEEPIAIAKGQLKTRILKSFRETREGFAYVMEKCNSHVIRVALCLVVMTLAWQTNLSEEIMRRKFGWTWAQLSYVSIMRMIVTLVSSLVLLPGASYIMTARLKLTTLTRDLTIVRVCGLLFLLGGGLIIISPTAAILFMGAGVWELGTVYNLVIKNLLVLAVALHENMTAAFPEYPTSFGLRDTLSRGTSGIIVVDRRTQTVIKWPVDSRTSYGIQQERKIYEKLLELGGHEGLLTYHGGVERYGLRLEYAAMCDLRSHIRYKGIGSPRTLQWMIQIARVLEFIHDAGVIHGSVSLTHVLLDVEGNARLGDFAWASLRSGTLMAKVFASHEYPGDRLSATGDLFALGSVMYELVTGSEPFVTCTDDEIRLRFKNGIFPDVASLGALGAIISKCWAGSYENTKAAVIDLEEPVRPQRLHKISLGW
ncbi:hypothetical protein NLG97_g702 [Lecanicillium saksenae]|uniref:Uncharacterized protein n=1 Tax=Lecanicillium saksenae TaxID=468837 RepID=A0ACC1R7R4_9HYPO|nr:hypothetical protein NLG97_g702 [Lecanicillium saksenae]